MWPTFFRQRERDSNRRNGKCHFRQSSLIDLCGRHQNFGQRTRRRAYRTIRRSHNCPIEHWSSRLRPIFHKKIFSSRRNLYRRSWEKSAQFCFFRFLSIEKIHFFLEIRLFLGFFPKSRLKKNWSPVHRTVRWEIYGIASLIFLPLDSYDLNPCDILWRKICSACSITVLNLFNVLPRRSSGEKLWMLLISLIFTTTCNFQLFFPCGSMWKKCYP